MPHIQVTFATRNFTDEQNQSFSDDLVEVLKKHLKVGDEAISVGFDEVEPANWKTEMYDTQIKPQLDKLVKKPGYEM